MKRDELEDELRPEYKREDFGPGRRGVHYAEACEGSNVVLLDPDVADAFPTDEAVNNALRELLKLRQAA
jgi:hypothetical protein